MLSFSPIDLWVLALYLSALIILSILYRAKKFVQMFGEDKRPAWLLLSSSLLMIEWSPMRDMMSMGIILENGYSGLWILKDRFWLAGVPAILFAPMWARLHFQTDNELIRLRYSGNSGRYLHIFRALFLALFVIPFFGAFIVLALRKLLAVSLPELPLSPELLLSGCLFLLIFKNSFHQKIRTDCFHAAICISAPAIVCYFLLKGHGGTAEVYETLPALMADKIALVPTFQKDDGGTALSNFLVFIMIQWWSVYIIDNSDHCAQRHFQAKNQFESFRNLFLPILITSFMFLLVSITWDCALLEYYQARPADIDHEAFYLHVALKYLPDGFRAFVLIAVLVSFITTLESIINWGGGLLTVDICQTYLYKNGSDCHYRWLSFAAMLIVATISLVFAFQHDRIISLQKFIFSISAGVAPVFLLRWFWWRINAWTQISAMLSSLVYTLIFDGLYQNHLGFHGQIDLLCNHLSLSYYPLKLIILTVLVVSTWLMVMACTQPDRAEHLALFVRKTGTGGIWPPGMAKEEYQLKRRVFLCLVFAATYILPYFFIWQFKFGDNFLALALLLVFVGLLLYVYRAMGQLLSTR